jgi:hypothetical protein
VSWSPITTSASLDSCSTNRVHRRQRSSGYLDKQTFVSSTAATHRREHPSSLFFFSHTLLKHTLRHCFAALEKHSTTRLLRFSSFVRFAIERVLFSSSHQTTLGASKTVFSALYLSVRLSLCTLVAANRHDRCFRIANVTHISIEPRAPHFDHGSSLIRAACSICALLTVAWKPTNRTFRR